MFSCKPKPFKPDISKRPRLFLITLTHWFLISLSLACNRNKEQATQQDTFEVSTVTYLSYPGRQLKMDLYVPNQRGQFPLIVWIHGGGWETGSRSDIEAGALQQVSRGYVVASLDYSLSHQKKWPAQIAEVKAAVRFLRHSAKKYKILPTQIAAWGMSAGGQLAGVLGATCNVKQFDGESLGYERYSSCVQAVVVWYAPSDFLTLENSPQHKHLSENSYEANLIGCAINKCPKKSLSASVTHHLDADDPPFFISHGTSDQIINVSQAYTLYQALNRTNIETELSIAKGFEHCDSRFNHPEQLTPIEKFLDRHLKFHPKKK